MKRFTKILESLTDQVNFDEDIKDLQEELVEIIDNAVNSDETNLKIETMNAFISDSETTIEGLVNDSDLFDFYLKYKNQFDMVLSEIEHFKKSPEDLGVLNSVYEYIVESTKIGIQEVFKKMLNKKEEE